MKSLLALASLTIIFIFAAAASQDYEDEAEMQKMEELASKKAEILKQALIQSALENKDEANLQNILAEVEQNPDDDDGDEAQLMEFITHIQSLRPYARTQWLRRAWRRVRRWLG